LRFEARRLSSVNPRITVVRKPAVEAADIITLGTRMAPPQVNPQSPAHIGRLTVCASGHEELLTGNLKLVGVSAQAPSAMHDV
jgi:hypothetical protein